jgi:hypothetical protein
MAYTSFLVPTEVTQDTGSSEISWVLDTNVQNETTGSGLNVPLTSFDSQSSGLLIFSKFRTNKVPAVKDDGSTATVVNGIECKIICNKDGRIKDSIIQLAQNGALIGTNKSSSSAGNIHTYGSSTDLWGTNLTYPDLSSLQIAVKYKSGTIPHRDTCYVYSAQLKIHYS